MKCKVLFVCSIKDSSQYMDFLYTVVVVSKTGLILFLKMRILLNKIRFCTFAAIDIREILDSFEMYLRYLECMLFDIIDTNFKNILYSLRFVVYLNRSSLKRLLFSFRNFTVFLANFLKFKLSFKTHFSIKFNCYEIFHIFFILRLLYSVKFIKELNNFYFKFSCR
jgi:hypothetical protein